MASYSLFEKVPEKTLLVHWGQSGGGPRFLRELTESAGKSRSIKGVSYNRHSDQIENAETSNLERLAVRTYRSRAGVLLGLPRLVWTSVRFRLFVLRNGYDHVVCVMESIYQSLAVPLALPRAVGYTVIVHDGANHPGEEHWVKRLGRFLELRRADRIVTLSSSVREQLIATKVPERKVLEAFHPAFSVTAPSPRTETEEGRERVEEGRERTTRLAFLGRIQPYKGLELLIGAVEILAVRGRSVSCTVHGHGFVNQQLLTCQFVSWDNRWIPEPEIETLLYGVDILIVPYTEASQSGVVAYAMATGTPVIATPVGGLSQQVIESNCGLVCERVDSASLADSIEQLIDDPALLLALASRGRESAATTYSWPRFIEDLKL